MCWPLPQNAVDICNFGPSIFQALLNEGLWEGAEARYMHTLIADPLQPDQHDSGLRLSINLEKGSCLPSQNPMHALLRSVHTSAA
jgi:hypothetical protein